MSKVATGGVDLIREAVAARPSVMAIMAKDCGVGMTMLDSFSQGHVDLPLEVLQAIVDWVWHGHIEYNAEADALTPVAQPEPRSIGVPPTWYIDLPKYQRGPLQRPGPQPGSTAGKAKAARGMDRRHLGVAHDVVHRASGFVGRVDKSTGPIKKGECGAARSIQDRAPAQEHLLINRVCSAIAG
jgi:hypothetical protein